MAKNIDDQREHEREKYKYIANNRDEFNGYGANAHGADLLLKIKELNPQSICDVGTATGKFCVMLEDIGIPEVVGVDFAFKPSGGKNIKWINSFAHDIPLGDKSMDFVTAFDFLEHVIEEDIDIVLKEFKRIAKRGFIFSVSYKKSCHEVNGENLHLTIHNQEWWSKKFSDYGKLQMIGRFYFLTF